MQPLVFRYAAVGRTHCGTRPLDIHVGEYSRTSCFSAMMWLSHGGLVISLQPLGQEFCLGLYLHDVTSISPARALPIAEKAAQK